MENEDKKIGFTAIVGSDGVVLDAGQYTNIPPKKPRRNSHGLMEGVNYIFKENGMVDWKAMIKPEYLVFNKEKAKEIEAKYKKSLAELSPSELEDKDKDRYLLILLAGFRDLARLRGTYSVVTNLDYVSDNKAAATTKILWAHNYENECNESTGSASADTNNTNGFGKYFLETMAENRSFVRCVRQYLGIAIVGFDEIKQLGEKEQAESAKSESNEITPSGTLSRWVEKAGLDFVKFKSRVAEAYKDQVQSDSTKWAAFSDIPPVDCFTLIGLLKEAFDKKAAAVNPAPTSDTPGTVTEPKKRGRPAKTPQ